MDVEACAEKLNRRFAGAVQSIEKAHAGDPFLVIDPPRIAEVCLWLRDDPEMRFEWLMCLSGVDYPPERIAVVYHLYSQTHKRRIVLKVLLDRTDPRVPSIESIWKMANWHERECYDMFAVIFEGHPLRKDYVYPETYRGITNKP